MKKGIVILCITVNILLSFGNIAVASITQRLIDKPIIKDVYVLGFFWILLSMTKVIKSYIFQKYYLERKKVHKSKLFKKIFLLPFISLESKHYNEKVYRLKEALSQEQTFVASIETIVSAGISTIGLYFLLFGKSDVVVILGLTVLLCIVILISSISSKKHSELMYDYWEKYIENTRKYKYISNVLTNKNYIEEKKVFSFLPYFTREFESEFDRASEKNRELGKKRIVLEFVMDVVFLFYSIISFLILGFSFLNNQITIGLFVSVTGYLISLLDIIENAIGSIDGIVKYRKLQQEYNKFSKHNQIKCNNKNNKDLLQYNQVLSIQNCSFKYPNSDKLVLNKVNLSFVKGKKYAIVGANGSGKTTLVKIISGLYNPDYGKVSSSSNPVVLFQDFNRYPATFKENITLSDVIDEEKNKKLKNIENQSGLSNKLKKMSFGDDTELTTLKDTGEDLSGGEWQRLALARVLWRDAEIYILDEPTASLDPLEEIRIFEAYNKLLKEKTVIYITHRLGFVKNVDKVIVLNNGSVVEMGTHDELIMQEESLYKNMFQEQRSWYE